MELSGLGAVVGEVNILKKKQEVNVVGDVNNNLTETLFCWNND